MIYRRAIDIAASEDLISVIIDDKIYKDIDINWYASKIGNVLFTNTNEYVKFAVLIDYEKNISIVNGIYTRDGGKHEDYVHGLIKTSLNDLWSVSLIRNIFSILVFIIVEDPVFNGQCKDKLASNLKDWSDDLSKYLVKIKKDIASMKSILKRHTIEKGKENSIAIIKKECRDKRYSKN